MPDRVTWVAWCARFFAAFSQLLSIRILIQFLGVEEYAAFAIISSISLWMALSDFGLGLTIQNQLAKYFASEDQEGLKKYFAEMQNALFGLLFIGTPAFLFIAYGLLLFFVPSEQYLVGGFFASLWFSNFIWCITGILSIVYKAFYGLRRGHWANVYPAIGTSISLILLVGLSNYYTFDGYRLILCIVAMSVPPLFAASLSYYHLFFRRFSGCPPRALSASNQPRIFAASTLISSLKFFVFALLLQVVLNTDFIIMSLILPASEIVAYKIIASMFSFVYSLCYANLLTFWPKSAAALRVGDVPFVSRALKGNIARSSLFLLLFALMALCLRSPLGAVLSSGQVQLPVVLIVSFLVLYIIRIIGDSFAVALASADKTLVFIIYLPIQILLSVFLQIYLAERIGVAGICFGIALSFLLTACWINPWAFKRLVLSKRG